MENPDIIKFEPSENFTKLRENFNFLVRKSAGEGNTTIIYNIEALYYKK